MCQHYRPSTLKTVTCHRPELRLIHTVKHFLRAHLEFEQLLAVEPVFTVIAAHHKARGIQFAARFERFLIGPFDEIRALIADLAQSSCERSQSESSES